MSFRESVIIPYALFKKCQFATPPLAPPSPPLPPPRKKEDTPEPDEPEAPRNVETPPLQPPPSPIEEAEKEEPQQKFNYPKRNEKENDIAKMARAVPEEDRPIVERILERVRAHPRVLGWTDDYQLIVNDLVSPKSNILEILKFIMKSQVVENYKGVPFGTKDFVDSLIDVIKIPKHWIKATFVRSSKRKRGGIHSEDDEDDGGMTISQPSKRTRSQIGHGTFPWISY